MSYTAWSQQSWANYFANKGIPYTMALVQLSMRIFGPNPALYTSAAISRGLGLYAGTSLNYYERRS